MFRAPTPPRNGEHQEARETLWELRQAASSAIRADLIALTDAVEVELFSGGAFRRRWRFLTDFAARGYTTRLRARLEQRAFRERRTGLRTSVWTADWHL